MTLSRLKPGFSSGAGKTINDLPLFDSGLMMLKGQPQNMDTPPVRNLSLLQTFLLLLKKTLRLLSLPD
jgi:hypothetical protein